MGINELIKIGDRLKTLRLKNGLTQSQLADKLEIPRTTYANYETNKREPKMDILKKIAENLNVTIDDILTMNFDYKNEDNDRLYILSLKLSELVPFYSFEEIEKALDLIKDKIDKGQLIVSEEKLNKNDEINILINKLQACDYPIEVADILSIKTAYNLPGDLYLKYFVESVNSDIVCFLNSAILDTNNSDDKNIAWSCIIDTLGFEYAYDIIENNLYYRRSYISSSIIADEVKEIVWAEFSKTPDRFGNNIKNKTEQNSNK